MKIMQTISIRGVASSKEELNRTNLGGDCHCAQGVSTQRSEVQQRTPHAQTPNTR